MLNRSQPVILPIHNFMEQDNPYGTFHTLLAFHIHTERAVFHRMEITSPFTSSPVPTGP
jgi:hypothetical protein